MIGQICACLSFGKPQKWLSIAKSKNNSEISFLQKSPLSIHSQGQKPLVWAEPVHRFSSRQVVAAEYTQCLCSSCYEKQCWRPGCGVSQTFYYIPCLEGCWRHTRNERPTFYEWANSQGPPALTAHLGTFSQTEVDIKWPVQTSLLHRVRPEGHWEICRTVGKKGKTFSKHENLSYKMTFFKNKNGFCN